MMMEPFDEIVNPLILNMSSDEEKYFNIPIDRTIQDLRNLLENNYSDVIKIDFSKTKIIKIFGLYQNKEEPRIGDRFIDDGSELEQPLAIARDIKKLYEIVFKKK